MCAFAFLFFTLNNFGVWDGLRRLAENVGIQQVGHGRLLKVEVACLGKIPFDLPILDRAILQDVHQFFGRH